MSSGLFLPDTRIVDPAGRPVQATGPETIGIDLVEATGGADALGTIKAIADLRRRREKSAILIIEPGEFTESVFVEVTLFNAEVYAGGRELTESDRMHVIAAAKKRWRRRDRRARNHFSEVQGQRR
jgi:hypothetical protein